MILLFRVYNSALKSYPLMTQCLTSATLMVSGDIISQKYIENNHIWNWKRTTRFGIFALCFAGPVLRTWYLYLDRKLGAYGKYVAIKKMLTDQIIFSPIFQFINIPLLGLMSGQSFDKIWETLKNDYIDIMIASYKVWPLTQLFNFYMIPLNYRLPFGALIAFFWNIYYTWKLGKL